LGVRGMFEWELFYGIAKILIPSFIRRLSAFIQ
jgi:hypothetical protein